MPRKSRKKQVQETIQNLKGKGNYSRPENGNGSSEENTDGGNNVNGKCG